MKFTLKDYQEEAVAQVLDRLKKSRKRWHDDKEKNAFSLTATPYMLRLCLTAFSTSRDILPQSNP